jgi:hypothetical protein
MRMWTKMLAAAGALALAACGLKASDSVDPSLTKGWSSVSLSLLYPPGTTYPGDPALASLKLEYCEYDPSITNIDPGPSDPLPCKASTLVVRDPGGTPPAGLNWSYQDGVYSMLIKQMKRSGTYWFRATGKDTAGETFKATATQTINGKHGSLVLLVQPTRSPTEFTNHVPRICAVYADSLVIPPSPDVDPVADRAKLSQVALKACWEDPNASPDDSASGADSGTGAPYQPRTWSWTATNPARSPGFFVPDSGTIPSARSGTILTTFFAAPTFEGRATITLRLYDRESKKSGTGFSFCIDVKGNDAEMEVYACVDRFPLVEFMRAESIDEPAHDPVQPFLGNLWPGQKTQITVEAQDDPADALEYFFSSGGCAAGDPGFETCCTSSAGCCGSFGSFPADHGDNKIYLTAKAAPFTGWCRVDVSVRDYMANPQGGAGSVCYQAYVDSCKRAHPEQPSLCSDPAPKGGEAVGTLWVYVGEPTMISAPYVVDATPTQSPIADAFGQVVQFVLTGSNPNANPNPIAYQWKVDGVDRGSPDMPALVGSTSTSHLDYLVGACSPGQSEHVIEVVMSTSVDPGSCPGCSLSGVAAAPPYSWTVACPAIQLDVLLAFDLSGSMAPLVGAAKGQANALTSGIAELVPDSAFGVASFVDYPTTPAAASCGYLQPYGSSATGDYAWKLDHDVTQVRADAVNVIDGLVTYWGGDGAQDYARALYEAQFAGWRDGARRVVVIFEDNVPHDCSLKDIDASCLSTGEDPGRDGIFGNSDDLTWKQVAADLKASGIAVIAIRPFGISDCGAWKYMVDETGGTIGTLAYDFGDLATTITTLVGGVLGIP